jgi:hypothetical protein
MVGRGRYERMNLQGKYRNEDQEDAEMRKLRPTEALRPLNVWHQTKGKQKKDQDFDSVNRNKQKNKMRLHALLHA